jgi:tRNA A37 threonylcarbamoyladenosine synthetase subunit TsaC/SUA5/YrdC
LTLVLSRSSEVPDIVTAGGSTVGIRWPRHPVMEAVIAACGFPLAAPSANLSGEASAKKSHLCLMEARRPWVSNLRSSTLPRAPPDCCAQE